MTKKQISALSIGLTTFAGLGGLALVGVLAPSPVRLGLYQTREIASPVLRYPESVRVLSREDLSVIAEHPLFNADRQKDPTPPLQSVLPGIDTYRLSGVIITAETCIAVVERKATKTTVTLKVGDTLDGRTVKEIKADGISFSGPSGLEILSTPKVVGASFVTQSAKSADISGTSARSLGTGDKDKK